MSKINYFHSVPVLSACNRVEPEEIVRNGLTTTPAQMLSLAQDGIPIASQCETTFHDGVENPSWDVPLESTRGVDIADLWTARQYVIRKARNAHLSDIAKYGE